MPNSNTQTLLTSLGNAADAIRAKDGTQNTMTVDEMAARIAAIPSGGGTNYEADIIERSISGDYSNSTATSIGNYAFQGCTALESISFPNATSIGNYAFQGCTALESVNIPDAASIGSMAFSGCTLASISLQSATSIGSNAFSNNATLSSVSISGAATIGDNAFNNCTSLSNVSAPFATSIGNYAFQKCPINVASFPNATSIGSYAFEQSTLTSCDFSSATSIGSYAFQSRKGTNGLSINFPNVRTVGSYAFNLGAKYGTITLPKATSLGRNVFYNTEVAVLDFCSPDRTAIPTGSVYMGGIQKIYINDDLVATMKADQYWSSFSNKIFGESDKPV